MNELFHHGIKGMKWGVRRYQDRKGRLTAAGRARANELAKSYRPDLADDITLKKGTKLQRIGTANETDTGSTYASFTEYDKHLYKSYADDDFLPTKASEIMNLTLSAIDDVKIAGGKAQIEAMLDIWQDKSLSELLSSSYKDNATRQLNKAKNSISNETYSRQQEAIDRQYKDYQEQYKWQLKTSLDIPGTFGEWFVNETSSRLIDRSTLTDEMIKRLSKKGYNAMIDLWDANVAEKPVFIFDRSKTVKTTSRKKLERKEIDKSIDWIDKHPRGDVAQSGVNMNDDILMGVDDLTPDELYHFGVKGMKWGIRRFQPYQPGDRVKGGKEVGLATKVQQRAGSIVEAYKKHRVKSRRVKALRKANAAKKAKAEHEAAKQKALSSGSAEDILQFKSELSSEETTKAILRLQNEKRLEDIAESTRKTGWDTMDSIMGKLNKVSGYVNTAAGLYESVNRLNRASKASEDFNKQEEEAARRKKIDKLVAKGDINKLYKMRNDDLVTDEDLRKASSKYDNAKKIKDTLDADKLKAERSKLGVDDAVDRGDMDKLFKLASDPKTSKYVKKEDIDASKNFSDARKSIDSAEKERQKEVQRIITSGDPDEIMKNRSKLKQEEFVQAMKGVTTTVTAYKQRKDYNKNIRQERTDKLKRTFGSGYRAGL